MSLLKAYECLFTMIQIKKKKKRMEENYANSKREKEEEREMSNQSPNPICFLLLLEILKIGEGIWGRLVILCHFLFCFVCAGTTFLKNLGLFSIFFFFSFKLVECWIGWKFEQLK